jgi:hypothetical protein
MEEGPRTLVRATASPVVEGVGVALAVEEDITTSIVVASPTVRSMVAIPKEENTKMSVLLAKIVYPPLASVWVVREESPLRETTTPCCGKPCEFLTVPLMDFSCAKV